MVSKADMRIESPARFRLIIALISTLALAACERNSDTHDPDAPDTLVPADTPAAGQPPEDEVAVGQDRTSERGTSGADDNNTGTASATGDNATEDSPNSEGQLICTPEWFAWVNTQIMATNSEAIAEQYPTGLPDVGSDEWFLAIDKLTGGDGAHGPDGGSDEWCFMMQQRLQKTD